MDDAMWRFEAFRRAYRLSLELHRASLEWPRVEQHGGIAGQLRRASKSVCALLVEGNGRRPRSEAEYGRYLMMAIGSADEARLWCVYAADLDYVAVATSRVWQQELSEIARMLQAVRQGLSEH
jgi:four helix bundle protein